VGVLLASGPIFKGIHGRMFTEGRSMYSNLQSCVGTYGAPFGTFSSDLVSCRVYAIISSILHKLVDSHHKLVEFDTFLSALFTCQNNAIESLGFSMNSLGFSMNSLGFLVNSLGLSMNSLGLSMNSLGLSVNSLGFSVNSMVGILHELVGFFMSRLDHKLVDFFINLLSSSHFG